MSSSEAQYSTVVVDAVSTWRSTGHIRTQSLHCALLPPKRHLSQRSIPLLPTEVVPVGEATEDRSLLLSLPGSVDGIAQLEEFLVITDKVVHLIPTSGMKILGSTQGRLFARNCDVHAEGHHLNDNMHCTARKETLKLL